VVQPIGDFITKILVSSANLVLFTNAGVVQPIRCFITKILVSSANLRFVHERKRCSANSLFHHEDSSFISQFAICSRTEALFSQFAISSRTSYFHQPTFPLFTNGSVVQPIRCFITKIPVSSANSRFVHERRRCSANWRFSSRRFQFHQPICDLFTNG